MTYDINCKGLPIYDIYRPLYQIGGHIIYRGTAGAVKFLPSSKCIDSIQFYGMRRFTTAELIVEIREHDTVEDKPRGIPGSQDGRIGNAISISHNNIQTTFGDVQIAISTLLPTIDMSLGVPYWIVIYSSDYICDPQYVGTGNERFELSKDNSLDFFLRYYTPVPCSWYSSDRGSFAMSVYINQYELPKQESSKAGIIVLALLSIGVIGTAMYLKKRR